MNRLMDCVIITFLIWFSFLPIVFFIATSDNIEITFNEAYLEEYGQCKLDLENTQPTCPDCVCKSGGDFIKYFLGFCFGAVSMFWLTQFLEDRKNKKKVKKK